MQKLKENGKIPGWRGELFPVTQAYDDEPFFLIERAAVSWFGLKARRALRGKIALTCLHSSACYVCNCALAAQCFLAFLSSGNPPASPKGNVCHRIRPHSDKLRRAALRDCFHVHSARAQAYGVHVNCYVERPDGSIDLVSAGKRLWAPA